MGGVEGQNTNPILCQLDPEPRMCREKGRKPVFTWEEKDAGREKTAKRMEHSSGLGTPLTHNKKYPLVLPKKRVCGEKRRPNAHREASIPALWEVEDQGGRAHPDPKTSKKNTERREKKEGENRPILFERLAADGACT